MMPALIAGTGFAAARSAARGNCSSDVGARRAGDATSRVSSPGESSSGWPWRGRSSTTPSCCSPTSRRGTSTPQTSERPARPALRAPRAQGALARGRDAQPDLAAAPTGAPDVGRSAPSGRPGVGMVRRTDVALGGSVVQLPESEDAGATMSDMVCDNCGPTDAVVHLTQIVEQPDVDPPPLRAMRRREGARERARSRVRTSRSRTSWPRWGRPLPDTSVPSRRSCAFCGLTFARLPGDGATRMSPLLRDVRRPTSAAAAADPRRHAARGQGLPPAGSDARPRWRSASTGCVGSLERAVESEDFERAAELRDQIRSMEPACDGMERLRRRFRTTASAGSRPAATTRTSSCPRGCASRGTSRVTPSARGRGSTIARRCSASSRSAAQAATSLRGGTLLEMPEVASPRLVASFAERRLVTRDLLGRRGRGTGAAGRPCTSPTREPRERHGQRGGPPPGAEPRLGAPHRRRRGASSTVSTRSWGASFPSPTTTSSDS